MPAVTADPLTLARIPEPAPGAVVRPVASITTAPRGFEGEGFPVRRAFAGVPQGQLDPFIHMDEMGAVDYGPGEPKGTSWHPHRGFETVTYMLDGIFQHQDSNGGGGVITDGATQWMTAGGGILHIETPPESLVMSGGLFHGLQLWVNLPARDKMTAPRYQSLESDQVALLTSPDGGAVLRIVAGDVGGHRGPGSTHTPIAFVHATLAPGAHLALAWRADFNALAYVLSGRGAAGGPAGARGGGRGAAALGAGAAVEGGQLAVFGQGDVLHLSADEGREPLEVIVLGGQPIREPVAWYGPFVMNTQAELAAAMEDYRAGRLGVIPPGALMPHAVG